jgi:hypothetical protein
MIPRCVGEPERREDGLAWVHWETGDGWESMAKVCVAIAGRGFVVRRVDWKQISGKRHTEVTPRSHVPDELLAMRRGVSRVVDAPRQSWWALKDSRGGWGDSLARLLFSATTHCDRLCVD